MVRDYPQYIERHAWLDYPIVKFKLAMVEADILNLPCLIEHATVAQYKNYFQQGGNIPRMNRLAEFIEKNGTWPMPPIILDNVEGEIVSP